MQNNRNYEALDFGTIPTTTELTEIRVKLEPSVMVEPYAVAYMNELRRRNTIKFDSLKLTRDDLFQYFSQLMIIRVRAIEGNLTCWRQAKKLMIPDWIQFTLTQIGIAIDRNKGLKFVPVIDGDVDIDLCLEISSKLASFEVDNVGMSEDAFPRETRGDLDTMSMAMIDGYVKGINTSHPISSYVSAFIGSKLMEEQAFSMLYRVRYDDIKFITDMLLHTKEIY